MPTAFTSAHLIGDGDPLSDVPLVRTGVVWVVRDGRVIRDYLGLTDELRADRRGAVVAVA